jgi:transcriptional regulator with XRE-family HTH domain
MIDNRYQTLTRKLRAAREAVNLTQSGLASKLQVPQSQVSKVESGERQLDPIELLDWLAAVGVDPIAFFIDLGWGTAPPSIPEIRDNSAAVPIPRGVESARGGVLQLLSWQGQHKKVLLENITPGEYLQVEAHVAALFGKLNDAHSGLSNREAIYEALNYAVTAVPKLNPSDVYHHIVYRLYLREYHRSKPEQSWVRAGGEAMELFVQNHYQPLLAPHGIRIQALLSGPAKAAALKEMSLAGAVGNSKLDVALYGATERGESIFAGVHCKASLAERVSDDVPASVAMMKRGYGSFLYTFDAKSFPPPTGDLVNRGELGTPTSPSDKRQYVENHGSFTACFSYNTRTVPSGVNTPSGSRIYASTLEQSEDAFPSVVVDFWKEFKRQQRG